MNSRNNFYLGYLTLALIVLISPQASAQGQGAGGGAPQQPAPGHASEAHRQGDRVKPDAEPASEIELLKTKVERLQALVEQQQRLLAEIEKRLGVGGATAQTAALNVARPSKAVDATGAQPAVERAPHGSDNALNTSLTSAQAQPAPAKGQDTPAPLAGWDRGRAFLRSADGSFETFITGYAQLDFRGYQSGNHPPNTFLVRRARLIVEGKVQRYFDYKIEGDFADTTSTPLRDFFVRVHRIEEFQMSFGQFRVPISQEEIRSDSVQDFVERSMVNNLVPSRSPGVMASGVIGKGVFEYQVGTFNGKGLLAANNNNTPESAIRLRFNPWKNGKGFWTKGLIFGGAYTQGRSLGGQSFRGQTESRSISFYTPDAINGQLNRANGELTWLLGPAAIRAEYVQSHQEREGLGPGGTDLPGVIGKGYVAQFTYLLTGETKPEASPVTPKRSLFDEANNRTGLGAWELKFRYANLQIANGTAKSNRAQSFFFGPNWYLNRFVRYVLDLGIERFKDPLRTPRPGDRNYFVVLNRFQVAF